MKFSYASNEPKISFLLSTHAPSLQKTTKKGREKFKREAQVPLLTRFVE